MWCARARVCVCVCVCVCVYTYVCVYLMAFDAMTSIWVIFGGGQTLEIVSFIVFVKEVGALWDKNEVARTLKPGAEKVCDKVAKCEPVERSCDLDTILLRGLGVIFPRGLGSIFPHGKIA